VIFGIGIIYIIVWINFIFGTGIWVKEKCKNIAICFFNVNEYCVNVSHKIILSYWSWYSLHVILTSSFKSEYEFTNFPWHRQFYTNFLVSLKHTFLCNNAYTYVSFVLSSHLHTIKSLWMNGHWQRLIWNHWVFGLCLSSSILKNTAFWKLDSFPSWGEMVQGTDSVSCVRKS
jgi:hypothetical protein